MFLIHLDLQDALDAYKEELAGDAIVHAHLQVRAWRVIVGAT